MVTEAGMREESYVHEWRDAKSRRASRRSVTRKRHETTPFRDAPSRRPVREALRDAGVYFEATAFPLGAGRLDGASSGFPGSVCTLQSKITYWRLTAVTRSAA